MKRILALLFLVLTVVGIAAPPVVPTPWRYGVIYWVGEVPEAPQAYVNIATNYVERVFSFWGLVPLPRPSGEWRKPRVIEAQTRAEALAILGAELSPQAVVVRGPEPGTFWVLPPLLLGDREIQPLTLVVFADVEAFQDAVGHYGAGGKFVLGGRKRELWEPWLAELVAELAAPVALVARKGLPPFAVKDYSLLVLIHEIAHWATLVWAQQQRLDVFSIPSLVVEGLADYTELVLFWGRPDSYPPSYVHPVAAVWARNAGFTNVPPQFVHPVGVSLVDFLARRHRWERFLVLLPEYLADWETNLLRWEAEWRDWLKGPLPEKAELLYQIVAQSLFFCARLVQPLFPQVWDLLASIETENDIQRFWDLLSGPVPAPTPELWGELGRRERSFAHLALDRDLPEEIRLGAKKLGEELRKLREEGDWEGYTAAYLEGVRTLIAGLPVPVPVEPLP